jgi:hypothetical protein
VPGSRFRPRAGAMAGAMAERRRSAPRRGRVAARDALDPVSTRQGFPIAALLEGGAAPTARVRGAPQGHRQPHDRGELQLARTKRRRRRRARRARRARASQPLSSRLSARDTDTSLACAAKASESSTPRRLVWRLSPTVTQSLSVVCQSWARIRRAATTLT